MTYGFWADFSMLLLGVISALLILVVLLQRGRGGGLAGAFGGLGGQSAFGTKAGDVFTKITIGLVTAWVLLAGISGVLARKDSAKFNGPADVTTGDDSKDTGSSISATGDSPREDEDTVAGDETTDNDASSDDSNDEAAKDDSEPDSSEKTEVEATPADDKDDAASPSSESETDSPDSNE